MRTFWCVLIIVLVAAAASLPAQAADKPPSHAGLVVRLSADQVLTRCVAFSEQRISGATLLERSGLALATSNDPGLGLAVCGIAGVGCPADNCFCDFPASYWQYWRLEATGWSASQVGASKRSVSDGAVDGWLWTASSDAGPLPDLTFAEICPAVTAAKLWLPLVGLGN